MRTKLENESSIKQIIQELSLEEKVNLLVTPSPCLSYGIEAMDIPSLVLEDGVTGVNGTNALLDFLTEVLKKHQSSNGERMPIGELLKELQKLIEMDEKEAVSQSKNNPIKQEFMEFLKKRRNPAGRFVSFPSGVNIGACFNEAGAFQIGKAVGEEMRASGVDVCLGPNVDIMRDPLGGRNYEMYGEDPILVGKTAASFVNGMQSIGVAACAKHFIANNQETNRQTKNTHVSNRTLRELYAKGFEKSVKDGQIKAVMSAYNAVNGIFSSYNKMLLTDWLKTEWGFDGIVVSDWGAVTGKNNESVAAGMDMILHGMAPCDGADIVEAVKNGTLSEERLNDAVERILKLILWIRNIRNEVELEYDQKSILKCAYDTIVDGTVLLKNEQTLPLNKNTKVTFYGNYAKEFMECGSGSTFIITSLHTNVYDEVEKAGIDLSYEDMQEADTVVYVACAQGGENADRSNMKLEKTDLEKMPFVLQKAKESGKKTVVVLNIAGPVEMNDWIEHADAVLSVFVPGCMGGQAVADILFGKAVPGGKLPMTFPKQLVDSPASPYPTGESNDIYYSEGVFVGYRWYDYKRIPVQYPFGYGLSYTDFETEVVEMKNTWDIKNEETFEIYVRVKNIGFCYGSEVIQVYLSKLNARLPLPEKELKTYAKVYLEQGEEKIVTLKVQKEDLEVFDPEKGSVIPIGDYKVFLGTSSQDLFEESNLKVLGENPYAMDENTTLGEILLSEEAQDVLKQYVPDFLDGLGDHLKMMINEKVGPVLSRYLIRTIPDANELKGLLDEIYEKLAKCI